MKTLTLLILASLAAGCGGPPREVAAYLRTPVPNDATALVYVSDEDYFWCILEFTPAQSAVFRHTVTNSTAWHPMPLPPELKVATNYLQPSFIGELKSPELIPLEKTTGYYIFVDYESEFTQKWDKSDTRINQPFYKRGGLNYSFGYFDEENGKLYVLWIHT